MNSASIWIFFPGLVAVILLLLQNREILVAILATVTAAGLTAVAVWLPLQEQIVLWRWVIPFSDTFLIFGRRIVLSATDRPTLIAIYLFAALWFGAAPIARPNKLFVPLGLGVAALLTAAIAIEPFLFAAVIIEIAALASIPFLSPPGSKAGRGVLRFLTYQTIGMPFILISGFMFTGFEVGPGNSQFVAIATALLVIGFALMLAVFPFHTWIPMLAEESHPYSTSYILLILPVALSIFGFGFLDSFVWLKDNPSTGLLLQVVGVVMILTAGIWAAVEKHLARVMGFAAILDVGFSLIAIGLAVGSDNEFFRVLFITGLLPRGLSLGILALALSALISRGGGLQIADIRGIGKEYPFISTSIVLALFCLAGIPLFAGFPLKLGLIEELTGVVPQIAVWAIIGSLGLIVAGIRILIVIVSGENEETGNKSPESGILKIFLTIGWILLVFLGLFPNIFIKVVLNLPAAFSQIGPLS
ncbi:MAG: proton-conducting transporter transmembrane domain-containing protein [Anaerolineales bacterium]